MTLFKRRNVDMTNGPLLVKILVFALPLILTNLLQSLYNAADMIVVGLSAENDAVGAIGTSSSFVQLLNNLFIGLAVGATVVVARHIGAGELEKANVAAHTSAVVGLVCGVIAGTIGIVFARPMMVLLGAEGRLLDLSIIYLRIYCAAMPFHALSNYAIAVYRAKGDTGTPLVVLAGTGLLNVLLNLFFVLVCNMSVEGVALATGVAALTSTAVLYGGLMRDNGPCRFSFKKLCVKGAEVAEILRIGIPAGIQNALFSVSNLLIQSSILKVNDLKVTDLHLENRADYYAPVVKGNAAAANLGTISAIAAGSTGNATVSFTGQNLGADKPERVWRVLGCSYLIGAVGSIAIAAVVCFGRDVWLGLYGVRYIEGDALAEIAYRTGVIRIWIVASFYVLDMAVNVGAGALRGMGKSLSSTLVSLFGICFFRVVWILTVFRHLAAIKSPYMLESIYIAYPISWVLTGAAQFALAAVILRRLIRQKREREAEAPTA